MKICNDCRFCILWNARDVRCVREKKWQKHPENAEFIRPDDKACVFYEDGETIEV